MSEDATLKHQRYTLGNSSIIDPISTQIHKFQTTVIPNPPCNLYIALSSKITLNQRQRFQTESLFQKRLNRSYRSIKMYPIEYQLFEIRKVNIF